MPIWKFGNEKKLTCREPTFPNWFISKFPNYFSLSSFNIAFAADDNIERIRLKSNAQKNPSTLIPSMNLSAMMMISALITKRKSPSVSIVIGNVSMINNGFTIIFNTANTNAKIIAVLKSMIWIPLKMEDNP